MGQKHAVIDFIVGLFIIIACGSLIFLAFRVSGLQTSTSSKAVYVVTAQFANIGDLKVRAPVQVSGVKVGQVTAIDLDPKTFRAVVTLSINHKYNDIPANSTASIYTAGLLGSNYVSIAPGFSDNNLTSGDVITHTNSALILENLIGQFLFSLKDNGSSHSQSSSSSPTTPADSSDQNRSAAAKSPITVQTPDLSAPAVTTNSLSQ